MSHNPFNDRLDWALQGKYVRVASALGTFEGWVEMVHHSRGSVILHDCVDIDSGEEVGSVFVRTPDTVLTLYPQKRIEYREVEELQPYPDHDLEFTPTDSMMRRCYRNRSMGAFPVVREDGTILNGHKRIAACRRVGLDQHPVEVVDVTDEQAAELFELAHRQHDHDDEEPDPHEPPAPDEPQESDAEPTSE